MTLGELGFYMREDLIYCESRNVREKTLLICNLGYTGKKTTKDLAFLVVGEIKNKSRSSQQPIRKA